MPLVSIVIPAYGMKGQGVKFLTRCLGSIEKQIDIDPKTLEIIVSDQSTDEVIENFCNAYSNSVKYYRTTTGLGFAAHNLNIGIARAKGQYIKILFQDDLLVENNYLSALTKIIYEVRPDCILTAALHTSDGKHYSEPMTPKYNPYFLFGNNTASSPSVVTLKRETAKILQFDEQLKMLFDCELYYRLFSMHLNIIITNKIHIANGLWEGQAQHQINYRQFTKEVRYLNQKYPQEKLSSKLFDYQSVFHSLHPHAQLPFSTNLKIKWWRNLLQKFKK